MDPNEKENKSQTPSSNKKVKVKISKNREIKGVGVAGDVVGMDEKLALQYARDGYVTILKKEKA